MIPFLKFIHIVIDPLCLYYDKPSDEQTTDLHKLFCNHSESTLKRAVALLKKSHKYKRFPFPSDLEGAIEHARMERQRDSTDPDKPREHCDACYGMGLKTTKRLDEMYGVEMETAGPCHCTEGDKVREGWKVHYSKHRYFRARPDRSPRGGVVL